MKKFFKTHIIPVWLWRDLHHFRKWIRLRKGKGLFAFTKAIIKEHLRIRERLDFPSKDIRLDISAVSELGRTYACKKEPETVQWIEKNVRPGDAFYDVGANVGAYSFIVSAITDGQCHVYAFEPSFSTFASLCRNVVLNGFDESITPLHIALSDKTEITSFQYSTIDPGSSQHKIVRGDGDNTTSSADGKTNLRIISYRLDDVINIFSLPLPNHIKIDVDGAERSVLEGAKHTLSQETMQTILIEIDEQLDPKGEIVLLLKDCGFSVVSKHSRMGSKTLFNYIFEKKFNNEQRGIFR